MRPDLDYVESVRLLAKLSTCDWTNLRVEIEQFLAAAKARNIVGDPFAFVALSPSPVDQLEGAKRYAKTLRSFPPAEARPIHSNERMRIAYLSADFHDHATSHLIAGLLEYHDRSRFQVAGISFGPRSTSTMRRRIENAVEIFLDVHDKTDEEIAGLLRELQIDIAVDLKGYTRDARPAVFARRPAPIQVNYLGYPGTMGAACIDYIIADSTVIPADQQVFYTEQVIWLPDSYQINDNRRLVPERVPARSECGLPDEGFVFCCFNQSYKIMPAVFDVWMRLLAATPGSVLWLFDDDANATATLRREATARGIPVDRLVFAGRTDLAGHLSRLCQADLVLDTLPYNAHTTASDALWVGVPVLTCLGSTFAGRVAASLLKAAALPELITTSLQDYEMLALKLAHDMPLLSSIKAKLVRNRNICPLFDTERTTRQIEAAYMTMWQAYCKRVQ